MFAISTSAQTFTLSELIKVNNLSFEDFDTYVIKKGYQYYENEIDEYAENTSYKSNVRGKAVSYISKAIFKDNSYEVLTFQTNDEKLYLSIKSELKLLGYVFEKKDVTKNGKLYLSYIKENIVITLISGVSEVTDINGNKYTVYEIGINKKL